MSPTQLQPVYRQVFLELERREVLKSYRAFAQQLLVASDGAVWSFMFHGLELDTR